MNNLRFFVILWRPVITYYHSVTPPWKISPTFVTFYNVSWKVYTLTFTLALAIIYLISRFHLNVNVLLRGFYLRNQITLRYIRFLHKLVCFLRKTNVCNTYEGIIYSSARLIFSPDSLSHAGCYDDRWRHCSPAWVIRRDCDRDPCRSQNRLTRYLGEMGIPFFVPQRILKI